MHKSLWFFRLLASLLGLFAATQAWAQRSLTAFVSNNQIINTGVAQVFFSSAGNEREVAFALEFNSAVLTLNNVTPAFHAQGATVTTQLSTGKIAVVVTKPVGMTFNQISAEIVTISFTAIPTNPTSTNLTFSNVSAENHFKDVSGTQLSGTYNSYFGFTAYTAVPPTIVSPPQNSPQLNSGNIAGFSVSVSGSSPISYQWRRNGVPLVGRIFSTIGVVADTTTEGIYDVVVTNVAGSVTSMPVTLSIGQLPVETLPRTQWVRTGDPVEFSIAPVTGGTVTYNWLKNGNPISRATPLYNLQGAATGDLAPGQPIPAGRWTTAIGGAMWAAGIGVDQTGQLAGVTSDRTFALGAIAPADLGIYSVAVTSSNGPENRGPASLSLRGSGSVGLQFIATGANGVIRTSNDGVTWSNRTTGTTAELRGTAALGNVAVAVGANGAILYSSDGSNWSQAFTHANTQLNAVTAGPDRFVAVGNGGRVLVSANGIHWYTAGSTTGLDLTSVTYGNGTYVMGGASGAIFVSPDGFKWANQNSNTTSTIRSVIFAGSQFWALASNNDLITSQNGFTWTRATSSAPAWFRNLAYNGQSLVAIGLEGRIYTSPDGVTWTPRASGTTESLLGLTWTGSEVPDGFAPASLLANLEPRILIQPRSTSVIAGQSASLSVAATGGGLAYQWYKDNNPIGGATQSTLPFASVQAPNVGAYRVTVTNATGSVTSDTVQLGLLGTSPLGGQFFAAGANGTVLSSADGVAFTERASNPAHTLRAIAVSAFRAIAVGHGNGLAVSADGTNWNFRTLTLPGTPRILRGIAAGPTQFVAVGSAGTVLLSLDQGETWELVPAGIAQSLWSVAWDGTRFVAVGDGGAVFASLDGRTWSTAASPGSARLYAITAVGAKLVIATEGGAIFESTNGGSSWQAAGSSSALWVRGAAIANNGRRVAVGDKGVIATSATGASWGFANSPTSDRLYGTIWTGGAGMVPADLAQAINGPALRIATAPTPLSVATGGTATFSVTAIGVSPLSYQWLKDSMDIPGATSATLLLANVQPAQAGSYAVVVTNASGFVASAPVVLTVLPAGGGIAPTLLSSPASRTVTAGSATNFNVVAGGPGPFSYVWKFGTQTIPGATGSTLALTNVQAANAGSYTVTVSNAFGSATSVPASLAVAPGVGQPVITLQPVGQSVSSGVAVALTVAASGGAPLAYQWLKNGNPVTGATGPTLAFDPVTLAHAGTYTVVVSNAAGSVESEPATLTVVPVGTSAVHDQIGAIGYIAGGTVTIFNRINFVGSAQSLGWEVLIPPGWSFASASGNQGDIQPVAGQTEVLGWAWTNPPSSPVTFTYTLNIPGGAFGTHPLVALAVVRQSGVPIQLLAQPDPLTLAPASSIHAADTGGDRRIGLFELTRVIELYNTRNGAVRTGAYQVDPQSEDGFKPDPTRAPQTAATLSRYHSADTQGATLGSPRDGAFNLFELTRVIELYNYRSGTVRTGEYHPQSGTEDGFAPGP